MIDHLITDLDDYQAEAVKLVLPQCWNATYLSLGLGESGEIQGKIKKTFRGDKMLANPEVKQEIKKELGDLFFYLATLSALLEFPLSEVATSNINKLLDRKERGVLQGDGDNR